MLITKGTPLQVVSTLTNIGAESGAPVTAIVTGLWFGNKDTDAGEVRANLIAFPAGVQPVPLLNFRERLHGFARSLWYSAEPGAEGWIA
jgi:hypothetical protein